MKYFFLILKHKWFVFWAGLKVRCPILLLLIHDWTKFLPCELPHYQRQFFGKADQPDQFIKCWVHHQNHNPHHWEYWIPRTGHNRCKPPYPDNKPIPMPEKYVREMVADWLGASRAYNKKKVDINNWEWFEANYKKIQPNLHPQTIKILKKVLKEIGYEEIC